MNIKDQTFFWEGEADLQQKMSLAGNTRELYQQTRLYAGKRRPPGILFLKDPDGNSLDSPEERMTEWIRHAASEQAVIVKRAILEQKISILLILLI